MADDPFDDVIRRLRSWTPPKGESLRDFELELRAVHGGKRHYIRSAHDPDAYVVKVGGCFRKRNGHPSGK